MRLNIYLSKESYEAMRRLQNLLGFATLSEAIEAALKLYGVERDKNGVVRGIRE